MPVQVRAQMNRGQGSAFNLGAKTTGEKFSKSIASPPKPKALPERQPDWVIKDQITPEQAIIYRLSGDYNPLHIGLSYPLSLLPYVYLP